MADIDLNGESFTPIASSVESFEGHYNGGGYVIRNMKIDADKGTGVGLFHHVSGVVERLGMVNSTIAGAADNSLTSGQSVALHSVIGTIAGSLSGNGQVRNCYAIGNSVSFIGQDTVFTMGTEYTSERFASGEVCYLLNEGKTENPIWRQTLGTDDMPVLTDNHGVVYTYQRNDKPAYSNTLITTPQYYISSVEDFKAFADKKGDIHLTQDINLGIWTTSPNLSGNLDGGGHTITYIGSDAFRGLFNNVKHGASIKHLHVKANVVTMSTCGGIAYSNNGVISDCHISGSICGRKTATSNSYGTSLIAGIVPYIKEYGSVDHCSFTGTIKSLFNSKFRVMHISNTVVSTPNYWTWVNSNDQSLYAAQRDSALNAQAEYPVYAKGILDAVGPEVILGDKSISAPGKHLASLTIKDGERFKCSAEVTVDQITYKRRGTNGAYEPWVLPFDYTIDASMLKEGMEFYWFEKDSVGNIVTKQIESGETYQAAANEPLAFRSTNADEIAFKMKLVKDGKNQPMTIQMPLDGVAASMASTKDIARVMVTYDSIAADRTIKERMYLWNNDKGDFVIGDGEQRVIPFRYYLQYLDKATNNFLKYEQTDWARKQRNSGGSQQAPQRRTEESASFSTLLAQGWQPIILDLNVTPTVTAQMLDDYEILCLSDIYEQKADNQRYDVTVIYEPVEEGMTLPYAAPLLVRAKRADVEPLVTEEMGAELIAIMEEALAEMDEEEAEKASESLFESCHYWCSTFAGRYDVWQMLLPESDNVLNEYGALVFGNTAADYHFYRVAASDGTSMQPMSYCFTAYDNKTYENLPLTNDRIEIVVYGYTEQDPTGIEDVRGKMDDVRGKMDDAYNLNGQKVGDSYRGIIIKNGRKIFKR